MLGCMILAIIGSGIAHMVRDRMEISNPYLDEILPVLPMAVLVIVGILSIFPFANRMERKYGYHCPHCNTQIAAPQRAGIVIASGNCPSCGNRISEKV